MLGINWPSILFHVFNFAVLVLVLNELLYKPILDFIEVRENEYREKELQTEENLKKSVEVLEENNKILENAYAEVEKIREDAISQAKIQSEKEIEIAKAEGKKIISDSKIQAQKEVDNLIRKTKKGLKEVAVEAAAKLLYESGDSYDDFINHVNEVQDER